jgi:hypothetical protein
MSPNPISRVFYRGIFDVPEKIRMRHFFAAVILLVVSVFLSGSPMDARAGTTITLKNIPGSLKVIDGRIDIDSIVSAFSLRASVDIMGDRLDLVGDGGSCRLLLGSSLVLSL